MGKTDTGNGLFIQEEDEEMHSDEIMEENDEVLTDNDPIIKSIPLILNTLPQDNQGIHILQYPGRPKTRPLNDGYYTASMKPESKYLEVKIPLDQSKFFNEGRTEEWGGGIADQRLHGVLDNSEEGMYVGQIIRENGQEKVVLVPVNSTAQLRPQFSYVDDIDAANYAQRRADYNDSKPANVHILQTAGKPNAQTNPEGHNSALGESLKHVKRFDEEDWSGLKWVKSDSANTIEIKQKLQNGADNLVLEPQNNMDEYIDILTS